MAEEAPKSNGFLSNTVNEIISTPINILLVIFIGVLLYKIAKSYIAGAKKQPEEPTLPKLKKRDFTLEDLKPYDGTGKDGRVLVAVNGNVYDVTKGKRFYGPDGPYAAFGGKDASRGLATFSLTTVTDGYDDLSDLNTMEMESVREWEAQFKEKYEFVGRLLKPGEQPTSYSDEEDESNASSSEKPTEEESAEKSKDD